MTNKNTFPILSDLLQSQKPTVADVAEAVQRFLPDPSERSAAVELMAHAVELANAENPSSWQITFSTKSDFIRLNVSRIATVSFMPSVVGIAISDPPEELELPLEGMERGDFKSLPGAGWFDMPSSRLVEMFERGAGPLFTKTVRRSAHQTSSTPYAGHHTPAVVDYLNEATNRSLPQPAWLKPPLEELRCRIVEILRKDYPGWDSFSHAAFVGDEIDYKHKAAQLASELLSHQELSRLGESNQSDQIVERIEKVAKSTNLLFLSTPSTGDLSILYSDRLDRVEFGKRITDLLHGDGDSPERLGRYLAWVEANELPNQWTFPTYFLFLCHPDSDLFLKPMVATSFLSLLGSPLKIRGAADSRVYAQCLDIAEELKELLAPEGARDMIDIQSVLWICGRAERIKSKGGGQRDQEPTSPEGQKSPRSTGSPTQDDVKPAHPVRELEEISGEFGFDLPLLKRWIRAIHRKGQAVLYGPPGTGKTFVAEQLAKHLIGGGRGWVDLVQFHPAYAYEDFIQGIRPQTEQGQVTYQLASGRFLEFCDTSRQTSDPCVLIIDEINRANLSRVFGELMYLLENRDKRIPLAGGRSFEIPSNVFIIGTMNTADRSIALVDHALRRRFAFLALPPNLGILGHFHESRETGFDPTGLIQQLEAVNQQINDRHYEIGISFFLKTDIEDQIEDIWSMEIVPYLEEYFFDQPEKAAAFAWLEVRGRILGE